MAIDGSDQSLADDVAAYYAARAPVYDESAGYGDPAADERRIPVKSRYRELLRGYDVLEVACGTGYWTAVVGEGAKSVLALDIHPTLLSIARRRCAHLPGVSFQTADVYSMAGVATGFGAAFGIWWWSHMPKGRIREFLAALHGRLEPGAVVLFVDQLPYGGHERRRDPGGNTLERRGLPGGRTFEIVKNFPGEGEVRAALEGLAEEISFAERPDEESWSVVYRTRR